MHKIINKPQYFFFTLSFIAILLAFIVSDNGFSVNIFSVYLIIPFKNATILASVFFLLISLNYYAITWVNKKANSILNIIHIILQVLAVFLIIYGGFVQVANNQNTFQSSTTITFTFIGILVFILSIFTHLINFFTSLLSKKD